MKNQYFPIGKKCCFCLFLAMRLPKYCILLLFFCCSCMALLAQQKRVVSQNIGSYDNEQALGTSKFFNDTAQIDSFLNYLSILTQSDPNSAEVLLQKMLNNCKVLNYNKGTAAVLANLGRICNIRGDNTGSITYYRMAQPYAESGFKNKALLAMFYNCLSAPFYNLSQFDSMYYYTTKAEKLIVGYKPKTLSDVVNMVGVYNNIGLLWAGVGSYDKTLHYLQKSLDINSSFPKNRERLDLDAGLLHSNIGMIFIEKKEFAAARMHLVKAEKLMPTNAITQMGLGELETEANNHKAADNFFRNAIALSRQSQNYANIISSSTRLGISLFKQKDYKQAQSILQDVVKYSNNLGNIDMENTLEAYKTLASIAAVSGDHKLAYVYQLESSKLLDSMKLKDKLLALYALESELKNAENEKANASQRLQISQSKYKFNLLLTIAVCAIAVTLGLFWMIHNSLRNKQRIHKNELSKLKQDDEIKALQSMMKGEEKERSRLAREIHDGIMVQFATIKMKMKSIPEIYEHTNAKTFLNSDYYWQIVNQMEDATRDLRLTAHNLMPDLLLQGGLETAISYFCSSIKKNIAIEVEFQKVGNINLLDKEFELNVYRIVQELLQNAIKHSGASKILIQIALLSETQFSLTVEDNGNGFDTSQVSKGLGMFSIANRLRVLNGNMDIYSKKGTGTSISIEFEGDFKQNDNDKNCNS